VPKRSPVPSCKTFIISGRVIGRVISSGVLRWMVVEIDHENQLMKEDGHGESQSEQSVQREPVRFPSKSLAPGSKETFC
jgi:hypothetical protein